MDCCFPDVSLETIETWWIHLQQCNKDCIKERAKLKMPFFAASEKMVNLVFNIGHLMELPRDILLTSVMLLDRFMSTSYNSIDKEASKHKKLKLMQKLKDNMILHICSCLQLSSKAVGQRDVLVSDIENFLVDNGKVITKREILKSEEYIFKTLKFQIPTHSPLIHVEILVHLLPAKNLGLDCAQFFETCAQYMMVAYCHNQALYDSLFYVFTSKETCCYKDRLEFLSVETDTVYLAGAATLAAAQTLGAEGTVMAEAGEAEEDMGATGETGGDGRPSWTEVRLEQLTGIPSRELQRLAALLTDLATDSSDMES